MQIKIFTTKMDLLSGLCVAKQLLTVQPNFVKKKNVTTKYSFFLCISTAKHSSSIEKQATVFHMGKTRHSQVYILDILFRQIIMFIKVPVTFVFGLQTL